MRRYLGLWVTVLILGSTPQAQGHGVPTHKNITSAAVGYLQNFTSDFCMIEKLQIGTKAEDDLPRPAFHFLPSLNAGAFIASCSSVDWGFSSHLCFASVLTKEFTQTNDHTWPTAVANAHDSATGELSEKGWEDLG